MTSMSPSFPPVLLNPEILVALAILVSLHVMREAESLLEWISTVAKTILLAWDVLLPPRDGCLGTCLFFLGSFFGFLPVPLCYLQIYAVFGFLGVQM